MSEKQLQILRTCAILHDIGKPRCWAKQKSWSDHINFTYNIISESLGEKLAEVAKHHHSGPSYSSDDRPKTDLEKIVCIADNLSSGADRREVPEHGAPLPKPPICLTHVLSKGDVDYKKMSSADLEYMTLELTDKLKKLKSEFDRDPRSGFFKIFEVLQNSSLKYVPADTRYPVNDVSLWDHLKLTAAFSTCIWFDGGYKSDRLEDYEFALICGDADKISRFVNLSSRLPDLNARSERIRKATEVAAACIVKLLGPENLIFFGGGGLLAISPTNMVEKVSQAVKSSFETATDGLVTMTVNFLKTNGNETQKEFGKVWKEAQWLMRFKKAEKVFNPFEGLPEEAEPCDVCHVRPKAHNTQKILPYDASPRSEGLCDSCWQLRKEGKGAVLDELGDERNLVAILRADGDDVGRVLGGDRFKDFKKVATPSRLSTISRHIHDVCEVGIETIVRDVGGRCLIKGGDDVLAVVPGKDSLETARRVALMFKSEMANSCTMSAGVAIFHYDLPIYAALEAADKLLYEAKLSKSKGAIAFAIIGGAGLTFDELEKVKHGPRKWDEFEEVLRLSKVMAEGSIASTQIRKIASAAKKDDTFAEVLIKTLMGRGEKGKGLSWSDGERLLYYLNSGILLDAFAVYNAFKM